MEQRQHLVSLALSGRFTVTELCAELSVSRKTAHKWIARYRESGPLIGILISNQPTRKNHSFSDCRQ